MSVACWTDEKRARAASMWREGLTTYQIAAELGVLKSSTCGMMARYRHMFPMRNPPRPKARVTEVAVQKDVGYRSDHVVRVTLSGSRVTLPRIPTIDGDAKVVGYLQYSEERPWI